MNEYRKYLDELWAKLATLRWTIVLLEEILRRGRRPPVAQRPVVQETVLRYEVPPAQPTVIIKEPVKGRSLSLLPVWLALASIIALLILVLFGQLRASPSSQPRVAASTPTPAPTAVPATPQPTVAPTPTPPQPIYIPAIYTPAPATPVPNPSPTPAPTQRPLLTFECNPSVFSAYPGAEFKAEISARFEKLLLEQGTVRERLMLVLELREPNIFFKNAKVYATRDTALDILNFYRAAAPRAKCMVERDLGTNVFLAFRNFSGNSIINIVPFIRGELGELDPVLSGFLILEFERN